MRTWKLVAACLVALLAAGCSDGDSGSGSDGFGPPIVEASSGDTMMGAPDRLQVRFPLRAGKEPGR